MPMIQARHDLPDYGNDEPVLSRSSIEREQDCRSRTDNNNTTQDV
jgi:hypothetical protein